MKNIELQLDDDGQYWWGVIPSMSKAKLPAKNPFQAESAKVYSTPQAESAKVYSTPQAESAKQYLQPARDLDDAFAQARSIFDGGEDAAFRRGYKRGEPLAAQKSAPPISGASVVPSVTVNKR